jgi:CubicO group peptidase (beta-lactamase class C family)
VKGHGVSPLVTTQRRPVGSNRSNTAASILYRSAGDGLAWSGSYGFTDAGRQSVATADTAYHAGTSALTSIMLLQLMHDGIVHLSDQVTTYVPEIASVGVRIRAPRPCR